MRPWFIKDTGFSRRIRPEDKAAFMRICPERRYAKGERVFIAGDPATHLHVICEGQVKLVALTASGNERIVAICGPDDFIGEAFLREEERYRVDAIALTEVMTCPMSRDQFKQLGRSASNFVLGFTEILTSYLFDCREQLAGSYAPVKLRVVRVLLEQVQRFGERLDQGDGWYALQTELKHEDIAAMTSATRVAVTMAITELREEGLITGSRGRYQLNVPALQSRLEP